MYRRLLRSRDPGPGLGVEHIDLWQLHRIDPKVPRDEQFDAVKALLADRLRCMDLLKLLTS
jgi:hypothetical protein